MRSREGASWPWAGALLSWFGDGFTAGNAAEPGSSEPGSFAVMASAAAAISRGAGGVLALPYFSGKGTPGNDSQARAFSRG